MSRYRPKKIIVFAEDRNIPRLVNSKNSIIRTQAGFTTQFQSALKNQYDQRKL